MRFECYYLLHCGDFGALTFAYYVTFFIAGGASDAVDIYNSSTGTWSTARLSVARHSLAATSVGNLSLFAGGEKSGTMFSKV
jgi:hypothetical protein